MRADVAMGPACCTSCMYASCTTILDSPHPDPHHRVLRQCIRDPCWPKGPYLDLLRHPCTLHSRALIRNTSLLPSDHRTQNFFLSLLPSLFLSTSSINFLFITHDICMFFFFFFTTTPLITISSLRHLIVAVFREKYSAVSISKFSLETSLFTVSNAQFLGLKGLIFLCTYLFLSPTDLGSEQVQRPLSISLDLRLVTKSALQSSLACGLSLRSLVLEKSNGLPPIPWTCACYSRSVCTYTNFVDLWIIPAASNQWRSARRPARPMPPPAIGEPNKSWDKDTIVSIVVSHNEQNAALYLGYKDLGLLRTHPCSHVFP